MMLLGTWTITAAMLIAILVIAWPLLQSPKILLLAYLYQLIHVFGLINAVQDVVGALVEGFSTGIGFGLLVLSAGVFTALSVLWFISIRYLTNPRRLTK